jgi:hypothetical protein
VAVRPQRSIRVIDIWVTFSGLICSTLLISHFLITSSEAVATLASGAGGSVTAFTAFCTFAAPRLSSSGPNFNYPDRGPINQWRPRLQRKFNLPPTRSFSIRTLICNNWQFIFAQCLYPGTKLAKAAPISVLTL